MKEAIGSLWRKTAKNGNEYLSGVIKQMNGQDLNIICFLNDKGENAKRPDFRIYLQEPRDQGSPF